MNILFVCNGNVARSQEAELFFNAASKLNHAQSAGVNAKAGKPIDPLVVEAMQEVGYSMLNAVRKLASVELVNAADLVISFKPYDELPEMIQQHKNVRYWTTPDPQHRSIEFHREVRDQIRQKIDKLVAELG